MLKKTLIIFTLFSFNAFNRPSYGSSDELNASSPDSQRLHNQADQSRWQEFSSQQIESVASVISSRFAKEYKKNILFKEIYTNLAVQRHNIALELEPDNKRVNWYGSFRGELSFSYEVIFDPAIKSQQAWAKMAPVMWERAKNLILESGNGSSIKIVSPFPQTIGSKYIPNLHLRKHPNHSLTLAEISFRDRSSIQIAYTSINKYDTTGDFIIANDYFIDALLAGNERDFFIASGKLMHLMAHVLPVELGNAGILEWIFRGMARYKGIRVGKWAWGDDKLSWDFEALLTPNRDSYAEWFYCHAFEA